MENIMNTQYKLTTNLDRYTIIFNGWVGRHNIEGSAPATQYADFVSWLIQSINDGTVEFHTDCDYEETLFEFYGQQVIDKAPFFIGERGDEARGFQLQTSALFGYTLENEYEGYEVLTNDEEEMVELIEDNEDLFLSYLSAYGIEPDDTSFSKTETSHTYTYRFHTCADVSDVLSTIENQLYGTLADTLLEWTQWYDEWTFTDSHTIDDEGSLTFTWTFTHPPITERLVSPFKAQQTA
jgi:hypothetical protein